MDTFEEEESNKNGERPKISARAGSILPRICLAAAAPDGRCLSMCVLLFCSCSTHTHTHRSVSDPVMSHSHPSSHPLWCESIDKLGNALVTV